MEFCLSTMRQRWISLFLFVFSLMISFAAPACAAQEPATSNSTAAVASRDAAATAIFAGGCFWCMEKPFDELPGVIDTTSGYTGGSVANPSYEQVSAGGTGHFEAVKVTYNASRVSYEELLDVFWRNIDPVDSRGQFCDKGSQYRSAIFYTNEEQQAVAVDSKAELANSGQFEQEVATEILVASEFYPAEEYHQDYYETHPMRYKIYRFGCGRDQRLAEIWGETAP